MSALLAALRISRRDALQARGRSALIMAMIGLPVLVVTAMLTLLVTAAVDPREGLTAELGTADARIRTTGFQTDVYQDATGRGWAASGEAVASARPRPTAEVAGLLGPGTRLLPLNEGGVEFRTPDGYEQVNAREVDLRDPLAAGLYRLLEGRLPASPREVVITAGTREMGVRLGATLPVTRQDRPVLVVGVVEHPHWVDRPEIVGFPGVLLDERNRMGPGWLADSPGPVTWAQVRRLNAAGLLAHSRAVTENPPATTAPYAGSPYVDVEWIAGIGLTGVMVVLEVVLLAGPAFAVGLRRRRRELSLIAAQGGSPGHLHTVVLADGLVLGGGAALLGLVLGVGLAALSAALEAGRLIGRVGPLDVPWPWIAVVAVLGTASGLAAAVVPAVQAARQDAAAVLGGRRSEPRGTRDRAGRPVLGAILLVAGIAAAFLAVRFSEVWVFAAALLSQLGLIALTPRLVRAVAGLAGRLPLPFRLAARDASRHRVRTASAVAAVMTATAAFTAGGVAVSSNFAENRDSFQALVPVGTLVVEGRDLDDAAWAKVRKAVRERLPDAPLIEAAEVRDETGQSRGMDIVPPSGSRRVFRGAELPVGDGRLLHLVQGRPDPVAGAAFGSGRAVVFDPSLLRDGRLTIEAWPHGEGEPRRVTVPAVTARAANPKHAVVVLPVSALRTAGLQTAPRRLYVPPDGHGFGTEEETRFRRDLAAVSAGKAGAYLERGFDGGYLAPQLWLLLGAALVLVLGGTFVATGLAAADLRPDLATMAAVGAPPGMRRLVIAGQAVFIAGLGVLVGALAGVVTGIGAAWPMTTRTRELVYLMEGHGEALPLPQGPPTIELPWLFLAAVVVGLPVLAAAVAALFARTKVTLTRRIA